MQQFDDVLAAALTGERGALEAIYRDLAPAVLGYARAQGSREPEDLAQEVFVGIVKGLGRFRGDEAAFRSWAFTIAHRRVQDERRRHYRRREELVDADTVDTMMAASAGGDAESEALVRSGTGWALEAIECLTPDQRDVVLLRILADLPVQQVARVLGKAEGAVKTLQRRALARLAREISHEGVS
jgi:RNA polymerase sigma-70 factor (ECF subfamily)